MPRPSFSWAGFLLLTAGHLNNCPKHLALHHGTENMRMPPARYSLNGLSVGAVRNSIERIDAKSKQWQTVCDKCATDSDDPWVDPHPMLFGAHYRVTAWNADGVGSAVSNVR